MKDKGKCLQHLQQKQTWLQLSTESQRHSLYAVTTLPVGRSPPINICRSSTGQKDTAEAEQKNRKEGQQTTRKNGRAQTELTTVTAGNLNSGLSASPLFTHNIYPQLYHSHSCQLRCFTLQTVAKVTLIKLGCLIPPTGPG